MHLEGQVPTRGLAQLSAVHDTAAAQHTAQGTGMPPLVYLRRTEYIVSKAVDQLTNPLEHLRVL